MWDFGGCNDGVHTMPRAGEDVVADIPLPKRLTVELVGFDLDGVLDWVLLGVRPFLPYQIHFFVFSFLLFNDTA